jgi:hypothetical protein
MPLRWLHAGMQALQGCVVVTLGEGGHYHPPNLLTHYTLPTHPAHCTGDYPWTKCREQAKGV